MAAYTIAYYPILLIAAGFLYLVFTVVMQAYQQVLNTFIDIFPGIITEQTVAAAAFGTNLIIASPAILMIVIAIWAIVRAGSGGVD
jgi:phenylacetate-coenzyme A ligase PaaK-like adenylate-forming protein